MYTRGKRTNLFVDVGVENGGGECYLGGLHRVFPTKLQAEVVFVPFKYLWKHKSSCENATQIPVKKFLWKYYSISCEYIKVPVKLLKHMLVI